jgi:hypothetical protein
MRKLAELTGEFIQECALAQAVDFRAVDTSSQDSTVVTRFGVPPRTTVGQMIGWSPRPFQRVVGQRMQPCLQSFRPKSTFQHERDCVEHLSKLLQNARAQAERDIDVLALCVDKTLGADHVERYSRENIEAAKAGVYISRVFAFDVDTREAALDVARAQLFAGVNVYLIHRDDLVRHLKRAYNLDLFGFTVIRGVEAQAELVLNSGAGETTTAASYGSPILADYFAGIHSTVRKVAERARPERAPRRLDDKRSRVQIEWMGSTVDAARIDYESTTEPQSAMSVTLHRRMPRGQSFQRNQVVRVSSSDLGMPNQQMRVSHVHRVNGAVCRRREHTNCLTAREGDYYLGLMRVA